MQQWEYLMASWKDGKLEANGKGYSGTAAMLNALGLQGWELVTTSTFVGSSTLTNLHTTSEYFYFKRPKP